MSKKSDGKKKGNNGDKKEVVAKVAKPKIIKIKGPKPDYKHSKPSVDVVQTDPLVMWNDWSGLVEVRGMRFLATKESTATGHKFPVVKVIAAPIGTELFGLTRRNIYIKVSSIHHLKFVSLFKVGTEEYATEWRIWKFFDNFFREMGLKQDVSKKPKPSSQQVVGFLGLKRHKARSAPLPGGAPGDKVVYVDNQKAA